MKLSMNGTQLKILALILMFIDHIAEFIPGIPLWFHYLGRISAPLFIFTMVWGLHYTHDRKVYLIRMYLFGVFMAFIDVISNNLCKHVNASYITNNIFVTLLLTGIICSIFDIRKQDKKRGNKYLCEFILFEIIGIFVAGIGRKLINLEALTMFFGAIMPNIFLCEGGFIFVALGVVLYYTKQNKIKYSIIYTLFSAFFVLLGILAHQNLLLEMYQWMMIGSLPFMWMYNNKKGKGLKYLFYVFYPVHILLLFWIGNIFF